MGEIFTWMKNMIGCFCILELLYHVVQNPEYQKYLRFFGGIVFMLLVLEPVWNIFQMESLFQEAFQKELLRGEIKEMQEAVLALGELQSDSVQEAYLSELERQIEAIVEWHGQIPVTEKIILEEGGCEISSIEVCCKRGREEKKDYEAGESIYAEIASLYGVSRERILLTMEE